VNLKENLTVLMHLNLIESHICKFNIEVFQYIEYKDTKSLKNFLSNTVTVDLMNGFQKI